jgi:hypothetical protein
MGDSRLSAAIALEAARHARTASECERFSPWASGVPRSRSSGNLIQRHPILSGAVIGAAVGTAIAFAAWGAEGTWVGFDGGAAIGASIGALASR